MCCSKGVLHRGLGIAASPDGARACHAAWPQARLSVMVAEDHSRRSLAQVAIVRCHKWHQLPLPRLRHALLGTHLRNQGTGVKCR